MLTSVMIEQERKDELLRKSPMKGTNPGQVRSYNERLILQLMREHKTLTKAEATRATGLSPNAMSVIFRGLEKEGLLLRGDPIRGRIGQPSVPLRINPDAHIYVSLKIGRRSFELAVVDFTGEVRALRSRALPFPTPSSTLAFLEEALGPLLKEANQTVDSISAMAVAMPFELWSWTEDFGAPTEEMELWRSFNAQEAFKDIVPWPITVENDATAACRAEVVFGSHSQKQDWIYFFVGTFIGGGIVLNGSVFTGRRGNAGGFGSMRVPEQDGGTRLLDHASLIVLEKAIVRSGGSPSDLYAEGADWIQWEPLVSEWIERASRNLAHAIVSALSVMDFEAVVLEGAVPDFVKDELVSSVRRRLQKSDMQGVVMPEIEPGQIGRSARAIGAAATVLSADYLIDQNTVLRR